MILAGDIGGTKSHLALFSESADGLEFVREQLDGFTAYQHPAGYLTRTDAEITAQWVGFFQSIGENIVDPGQPVFERTAIGDVGTGTQLGGYSVVETGTLEDAVALAKHCPTLTYGGGVQVGELAELPPEHPASQLKARLAGA